MFSSLQEVGFRQRGAFPASRSRTLPCSAGTDAGVTPDRQAGTSPLPKVWQCDAFLLNIASHRRTKYNWQLTATQRQGRQQRLCCAADYQDLTWL